MNEIYLYSYLLLFIILLFHTISFSIVFSNLFDFLTPVKSLYFFVSIFSIIIFIIVNLFIEQTIILNIGIFLLFILIILYIIFIWSFPYKEKRKNYIHYDGVISLFISCIIITILTILFGFGISDYNLISVLLLFIFLNICIFGLSYIITLGIIKKDIDYFKLF